MKHHIEEINFEDTSEINTVYSDVITFVAALFILLFTLVYNQQNVQTYFMEMRLKMGSKEVQQQETVSPEDLFVSKVQGYIQEEDLSQYALILVDEQKIRLILNDPVLFQPGGYTVSEQGKKVLRGLSTIIDKVKNPIVIEGHTDNHPVKGGKFDSNWDLSMARGYSVLKFMLENTGINENNLSVKAFGDKQPIAPNKTKEGRAKNRRVEINIVRVKKVELKN